MFKAFLNIQAGNAAMQKSDERTGFMRQGKAGGWKKEFTPELEERFNAWEEARLKNTDFRFSYE